MSNISASQEWRIKCLVPDLPDPVDVAPLLAEMHENRWYTNFGPLNERFKDACAALFAATSTDLATDLAVSTFSSATAGMEVLLVAMGLRRGAKVLVPSLTFPATALAVIRAGYEPVIADVDPATYALTPSIARACLNKTQLDAVIPVSPYGIPLDIDAWEHFKAETGVPVVIDAAAAFPFQKPGATVPIVFSLHATKPFGIGEGGLVVCGDAALVKKARLLSNFGFENYEVVTPGSNAKMGEYYAAVGLVQLDRFDELIAKSKAIWSAYKEALAPYSDTVTIVGADTDYLPANLLLLIGNSIVPI